MQHGEAVGAAVFELEQPHKGGGSVWTGANVGLILESEGQCAGLLGVTRDITWRRRAQQAKRERLALYIAKNNDCNQVVLS